MDYDTESMPLLKLRPTSSHYASKCHLKILNLNLEFISICFFIFALVTYE